ncbi:MAG: chemotaxis protein CheW [Bryobacteraceae bacterium]|nr:chemotaxis protein CheW [Bryobacteraceae bacterium]
MQQWEEPAEPLGQAAENLPLAGLLAELLAGAEADNEGTLAAGLPGPEGAPAAAGESWLAESATAGAAVPDLMRALGEAEQERQEAASGEVSGQLLARLMGDAPPSCPAEPPEEPQEAAAPARAAVELEPAAVADLPGVAEGTPSPEVLGVELELLAEPAVPQGEAQAGAETPAPAEEIASPQWPESLPAAAAALEGEEEAPAGEGVVPLGIESAGATGEAAEAGIQCGVLLVPDSSAAAGPEPVVPVPGAPELPEAGVPAGLAAALEADSAPAPAGEAASEGFPWKESAGEPALAAAHEARADLPAPSGAALAQDFPAAVLPPSEEDDFELVDAETAGRMLDQLIDAARSAIRSSMPPPANAPAGDEGGTAEAALPEEEPSPAAQPALPAPPAGEASTAGENGQGRAVPSLRPIRPAPAAADDEMAQEPPPLPPAAALIGMGLPERLRARLEALGDVEKVLAAQSDSASGKAVDQRRRLLVFRVGGAHYGLPIEHVREVERVARLTPVPGAPRFVRGLVNLRGEILPLLDMRLLLGAGGGELPASPRLIVAQADRQEPPLALMVEELNGLAPVEEESPGAFPPGESGALPHGVRGSLEHRGRRVWRLDPAALLSLAALEERAEWR